MSPPLPDPVEPTQRMQESASCLHLSWLTVMKGELSDTARPAILHLSPPARTVHSTYLGNKTCKLN